MEDINIGQFMSYFGSYYPILIPSIVALCVIVALLLDQLRVWAITYVDEGETGPYKKYVLPFLHKLTGNMPPDEEKASNSISSGVAISINAYCKDYSAIEVDKYEYGVTLSCGNKVWLRFEHQMDKLQEAKKEVGSLNFLQFRSLARLGFHSPYCESKDKKVKWKPFDSVLLLGMYLVVAAAALTAYKFLPELTIGALVGYGVLRTARSIVRLTKRFNKHISDGHGVKEE